jgi:hypothetical protein
VPAGQRAELTPLSYSGDENSWENKSDKISDKKHRTAKIKAEKNRKLN